MKRETRVFNLRGEVRAANGELGRSFDGHASVFNQLSEELFGFYERVAPTAFDRAVNGEDDVRLLFNHNPDHVLARNKRGVGTLALSKDDESLRAQADLPDIQIARDLSVMMDRGDVDQMSFGFRTIEDSWDEEQIPVEVEGQETQITIVVRTLISVELFDVSPVTFPAYPQTDAEVNSVAFRYLGLPAKRGKAEPVPATLARGEVVLNVAQQRALAEALDRPLEEFLSDPATHEATLAPTVLPPVDQIRQAAESLDAAAASVRALLERAQDGEPDPIPFDPAPISFRRRRLELVELAAAH